MRARAVAALKAEHRLEVLLKVSGLARSTFFYHQARLELPDPRAALKADITRLFEANKGRYGHRRIHGRLLAQGHKVAKKTVLKLMGRLGLACQVRRRRSYSSYRGQAGEVAPNLLERDFTARGPNRKWVTDVTEFAVAGRKVYLSPVMDLFDRQVISYTAGLSPNLELTNASLREALETLAPGQRPLVHSDQGFQYQHMSWRRLLAGAGCIQSMSRKGNCLDNAVIESFFGHLKEEFFTHAEFDCVEEFTAGLDEYIAWFNHERVHSYLEGLSPVQYRAQALAA
ncbi:IS3 family transposase [Nocardiopsis dassonvillei]|uniref:IS3 family transposase n=1 Tax=Nocardiopsis dassonvillei TaxID=2014 RepID=UPI00363A9120